MDWNWAIYLYLWLAGMAGGAYFSAFLASRFSRDGENKLLKTATITGIPLAAVGVLLLIIELGEQLDFWHLFTRFDITSPMSIGTWILTLWIGIAAVMTAIWWYESRSSAMRHYERITSFLGWVEVVLSALLIAYTGVLLAVSNKPLWSSTALLPALFVASAVSTGLALLIAVSLIKRSVPDDMIHKLAETDIVVIGVELVILIGYMIWLAATGIAGSGDALSTLVSGSLAIPFWIGVVLVALLVPLGLEIANQGKSIETRAVWRTLMTSSVCVILGGLVLRAVIVIGGQL